MGELRLILGLECELDRLQRISYLHQTNYAKHILETFGMATCNPAPTPMDLSVNLLDAGELINDVKGYQEIVGSLDYLVTGTRPDLSCSVGVAGRFMSQRKTLHFILLKEFYAT
jgi:hypothetical protein